MVSTRKFVGKLNPQQAIRLVRGKAGKKRTGLQPRIGRHVRLDSAMQAVKQAHEPEKAKQALQKWLKWIHEQWFKSKTPKRRLELQHQRELLMVLHLFGQRQPTAHQLSAVLALCYGLRKEHLAPRLNTPANIQHRRPQFKTWQGSISMILAATNLDLPYKIEKILANEKKILDSKEIAARIGIEWNSNNAAKINTALQLLNQMAVIEKQPMHAAPRTPRATWSHKKHPALEIRHPNTSLEILEAIYENLGKNRENRLNLSEIYNPYKHKGREKKGKEKFSNRAMIFTARALEKSGLVKIQKNRVGKTTFLELALTPEGIRLMEEFYRKGRKSFPLLRRYLLGIKE